MNDEATPSSTAPHLPTPERSTSPLVACDGAHDDAYSVYDAAEEQQKRIAEKKAANLKDIVREFDILVYAQLAAVYYME